MDNDHLLERNQRLYDAALPIAYKEAIPSNLDILDIFEIDGTGFDFANKWITTLLGQRTTHFTINPPVISTHKIEHLFFKARNTERLKGYKNIGFGYPILAKKDRQAASGFLAVPIFIWDIQLEPDRLQVNQWQISARKPIAVRINPVLEGLRPEVTELITTFNKRLNKRGVTMDICTQFCETLAELMEYQNEPLNYSIEQFPDIVDLATMQQPGAIIWSGIFSIFPPIHFYTLSDSILSKEYWQAQIADDSKNSYQFCYLPADHQQKAAHLASLKNKFVLVEGAAGSGKDYTICNALINQLANGKSTIIVGQSIAALEKITDKLTQEGFGEYAFLFKNSELDKDNLIENLIARADKTKKQKIARSSNFSSTYKQFTKVSQQLELTAGSFAKNVFDINNWTETVGLYLKNSRQAGKELLDTQLNTNDFEFNFFEYEQLKEKIEKSEALFQEAFSFHHPLNDVDDAHFTETSLQEAKNKLLAKLNKYLNKTRKVQRTYFQKVGLYKQELEDYYENYYENLQRQIIETKESIDQLQLQFGHEYDKTSVGNLKILKTFSGKSKKALTLKSAILTQFEQLKTIHFEKPAFDFQFLETATTGNITILETQLKDFEQQLQDWKTTNRYLIQDKVKNLNSKTVLSGMKSAEQIATLEQTVETLVRTINKSKLFKQAFNNNGMTLQLKQHLLDEIIEKLNSTIYSIRDFDVFFEWQNLGASCSVKEAKTVKSLIKVRPKSWIAAFEAWYFHNLLTKEGGQNINFEPLLAAHLHHYEQLKTQTPAFIHATWQNIRTRAITATRSSDKRSLNTFLKKAKSKIAFIKYMNIHLARIQRFYPIILVTTEMAKELFTPPIKAKFDSLIIKEGAELTKEQGGSLLNLANTVQVFGRGIEEQSLAPNSFWYLARSLAGKHVLLKNQHRSKATPILAFNNAAFDQQLEVYLNGQVDQETLQIYEVNGDYDESLKTNEAECRYMLSLLTGIKGTPQNTYPKVGFVCATVEQRNLFAGYLLKIKQNQANGADKIKHLERNGMGVYAFEELQGQVFDVLIISFTYGVINEVGVLTKDIQFLNTPIGQKRLQQLLNSGTQKIAVCHSFPKTFGQQYRNKQPKNGLSVLANFLAFGKAVGAGNTVIVHDIINRLAVNKGNPQLDNSAIFLAEVANYLTAYFEPSRILRNYSVKNKIYPLVIKGKEAGELNYIIEADQFSSKSTVFSFIWHRQTSQAMEAAGYKIITIWSRDWWRNPEAEARKLASKIIRKEAK